jgi:hypothetical protein
MKTLFLVPTGGIDASESIPGLLRVYKYGLRIAKGRMEVL